jgi:hypothetical protein
VSCAQRDTLSAHDPVAAGCAAEFSAPASGRGANGARAATAPAAVVVFKNCLREKGGIVMGPSVGVLASIECYGGNSI